MIEGFINLYADFPFLSSCYLCSRAQPISSYFSDGEITLEILGSSLFSGRIRPHIGTQLRCLFQDSYGSCFKWVEDFVMVVVFLFIESRESVSSAFKTSLA